MQRKFLTYIFISGTLLLTAHKPDACNSPSVDSLIKELQQEYTDFGAGTVPPHDAFLNPDEDYNYADAKYQTAHIGITWYYVNLPARHTSIGSPHLTCAYRNPRKNWAVGGSPNSYHIYGRAIDYDQGSSLANYQEWETAKNSSPAENILYDQYDQKYYNPSWPPPEGISYEHGHVAW